MTLPRRHKGDVTKTVVRFGFTNIFTRAWAFMLIVGILEHSHIVARTLAYTTCLIVMCLAAFVLDDRATETD